METQRLNDNEVREVATMQTKIDTYESFISAVFGMIRFKKELNYMITTDVPLQSEMNKVYRFVKEAIKTKEPQI